MTDFLAQVAFAAMPAIAVIACAGGACLEKMKDK